MIDFIDYVVSELKSKRLSKRNALALLKQFSLNTSATAKASVIHPLLHKNTSDLYQQSYSTIFTGEEFFLKDHKVNIDGNQDIQVLPGVAYLEMARSALDQALPTLTDSSILELRNTAWMNPIIVTEDKQISIALFANDNEEIDIEIYSQDVNSEGDIQETMHCQGHAVYVEKTTNTKLNIEQLKGKMLRGKLDSKSIYTAYTKMGINYGPSHQLISEIYQGKEELLSQLQLPEDFEIDQSKFLLHPGLMDGALQSSLGLIDDINQIPSRPTLPLALENLRILSPCTKQMFVWVRYSKGSKPEDKITRLDIDLCDTEGNICVQMHGFTSKTLSEDISTNTIRNNAKSNLLAAPVWELDEVEITTETKQTEFVQHHILLCNFTELDKKELEKNISTSQCLLLQTSKQKNIAERYSEIALSCFKHIQAILKDKPQGRVLVQIVIANTQEEALLSGLSGLLKTASLENPQISGQIILTDQSIKTDNLIDKLLLEKGRSQDTIIKYEQDTRRVLRLQEIQKATQESNVIFNDQGIYLITGGFGGLGLLFTKEILKQTTKARIILTGRSKLTSDKEAILKTLSDLGNRVEYRQLDLNDLKEVKQCITSIKNSYKQLNGIIHSAGMISDNFILKKTSEEFKKVLEPKITGSYNLDEASKGIELDFLMLFSSTVSWLGNLGQADYASANGFMDQFAVYRNQLVEAKQRQGKTLSISWPIWQEGGMNIAPEIMEQMQQATGIYPMQTETGMNAIYQSMELLYAQTLVIEGDLVKVRHGLFASREIQTEPSISKSKPTEELKKPATEIDANNISDKVKEYLRKEFSKVLKIPAHKIEVQAPLENYGINSILAMNLTGQLEKTFGNLSKTLFFEYQTIDELTGYFTKNYNDKLSLLFEVPPQSTSQKQVKEVPVKTKPEPELRSRAQRRLSRQQLPNGSSKALSTEPIAIVGLSGRYPESKNIEEFWLNLQGGKDCVTEVPKERWDWKDYYSDDPTKPSIHSSKWGGFISGVDEFDPRFFNISPREANYIDPQERLFLQHAWMAVEDAGYTRASLQIPHENDQPAQVGVYVGVMYGEYNLSGSLASIANRVSYVLNLHGPSMTLDTMCSSSLTAIHLACQDLKQGRTNLAIAGGVNISIHPNKYKMLSSGQFISSDGRCQSFGEGGNGYIPSEGVGAVMLKRLSEAERDGNHIYGVIKGSGLNHGGKTNGYTVPNPQSQASAINLALRESKTDPRHISYIEAHGTGTKLGDPIEIAALSKAFQQYTEENCFCLIGSAKSNIGHSESAAGMAGITKVLLQMKYQKIVPSLHSTKLNPNIDFEKTPFVVNQELRIWEQPVINGKQIPRQAGVSSFGAGGSNAHIILQEYLPKVNHSVSADDKVIIPLSARNAEHLQQKVSDLFNFINNYNLEENASLTPLDLKALAYTLQVGREAMEERLGLMVSSVAQLVEKLQEFIQGKQDIEDFYQGQVKNNIDTLSLFAADSDFQETIGKWFTQKKLEKLIELWVKGLDLDWNKLYGEGKPSRISLPTYPFARERYWIEPIGINQESEKTTSVLHPLLHANTSDFQQQSFSSTFNGEEFFVRDYHLKITTGPEQKALPSVVGLEMAHAAVRQVLPNSQESSILELQNIVWGYPIVFKENSKLTVALFAEYADDDSHKQIDFEIYSTDSAQDIVHSQGHVVINHQVVPERIEITKLKAQMQNGELDVSNLYDFFACLEITYGQAYQGIKAIYKGDKQLLAELRLPDSAGKSNESYILHPSIMESTVQASIALLGDSNQLSNNPVLLFALDMVRVVSACTKDMFAWIRYAQGNTTEEKTNKLDIDLYDQNGNVSVQIRGLSLKQAEITEDDQSGFKPHTTNEFLIPSSPIVAKPQSVQLNTLNEINVVNNSTLPGSKPIIQLIDSHTVSSDIGITPQEQSIQIQNMPLKTLDSIENTELLNTETKTTAIDYSLEQVRVELRKSLAEALFMEPSEIDVNKSFVDLGLDSIVGVEWVNAVNKQFSLEISATRVYDYSNIKEFATFIKQELKETPVSQIIEQKPVVPDLSNQTQQLETVVKPKTVALNAFNDAKAVASFSTTVFSLEQVQGELRKSLAEALFLQPSEIDVNKAFVDLGLDSIVGVEWVNAVNKQFSLEISATRVYDYSNIKEFATFIKQELKEIPVSQIIEQKAVVPDLSNQTKQQETVVKPKTVALNVLNDAKAVASSSTTVFSLEQVQGELRKSLAEALFMESSEIDVNKSFVDLGLDSIVGVEWVNAVNKQFSLEISATRVYDYSNIKEFATFIKQELKEIPVSQIIEQKPTVQQKPENIKPEALNPLNGADLQFFSSFPILKKRPRTKQKIQTPVVAENKPEPKNNKIAIIGMSGRYPEASNLQQYWENLANGKNSIVEIPKSRWDVDKYYDPDPTKNDKTYCKWLGMLDDVDQFDPLFFQIPPSDAEYMDPQHRIFLQESYKAFEDAGYSRKTLSNKKCGVYLGIMSSEYSYHLAKSNSSVVNTTANSFAIGVSRIAYFLNLKGPAIPFDTACSSSLVAMHVACQGLLNGETDLALAGGVSLYLIPEAYLGMSQAGMLSPEGQCKTFDNSANGFVPGEGVGALVLKRLEDAERDNDFIYGVILGSGINQDGKTNGITAPSVNSQIELEREIYSRYKIDPETISYVEAHGTGTKLGDPIELEAISTVFKEKTSKKNYCALGSVKSNIGHTSGAAGVASVHKVLLSMKHKTLVPTLNVKNENKIFDLKKSPFYISKEKQDWNVDQGSLRRASISAFGFSGTNAHMVIEEYPMQAGDKQPVLVTSHKHGFIIPISARTIEQLKIKAVDLLDFVRKNEPSVDLMNMAFTLQVGRDEMKERLGFVVDSVAQLIEKLQAYVAGDHNIDNVIQGQVARDKDTMNMFDTDADLQKIVEQWINDKKLFNIVDLWVKGLELDWNKLYQGNKPQRISLPLYPFAKERYWVDLPQDSTVDVHKSEETTTVKAVSDIEEKIQNLYFYPDWNEVKLPVTNGKQGITGPILIFDTNDELYRSLNENLSEIIDRNWLIFVKLDNSYLEVEPNKYTINPEKEEHFVKLIENLKANGQLPHHIIHQGLVPEFMENKKTIKHQLNYSFYALFYFCKALMVQKHQIPLQILSLFSTKANMTAPQNAALGGFFKTLTMENPKYQTKIIEIQRDSDNQNSSATEKASIILDEIKDRNWNKNEICYKFQNDNQQYIRYVRKLNQITLSEGKINELPLKQNGVYIVSGGFGGLGFIFSEYLVKKYQCKLVLFGRSELKAEQEEKLNQLKAFNTEIIYVQADASNLEDMKTVVKTAKDRFSQINGVIHSAGISKDSFILKKTKEDLDKVLEAKIYGTINLDLATKEEKIDLFVMFSSIAGVMGNLGQCDYAYGNHFMDSFAESRENMVNAQTRFGKTLSINWPYWEEGGMLLSKDELAVIKNQSGICPLPTTVGIRFYEEFLQSGLSQGVALYGYPSRIKAYVTQETLNNDKDKPAKEDIMDANILIEKTETYLKNLIGNEIKLDPEKIDSREPFESFGIDSIVVSRINVSLEKDLGPLSKTLFYEYTTIEELAGYLTIEAWQSLSRYFTIENSSYKPDIQNIEVNVAEVAQQVQNKYEDSEPIAIIGVHGCYPKSEDLNKYWENLKQGKDLVDLVPEDRWDYKQYYHNDPEKASEGKIYCKWGGFINDVDKFDPQFFNIDPEEAKIIDPQERLFLQSARAAIEDAGYTKESLKRHHLKSKSADVGVFVGVTTNTYQFVAEDEWKRGNFVNSSAMPWSIPNRVSYYFDFRGPSMPVDTACSSSLVAIHLACESLKKQECQVAIAGGVNLYLHPSKYHSLCKRRMVSQNGKCHSYGAGDDGFVPGEGVGSILLKPLSKAVEDKDHIYAVIPACSVDHGGRSNGYAAPNPNSQANLISQTLHKANINPETISYIEGHGTGTQLGDSLEIVALTNAFKEQTNKKQFCPVGSVKANMGHSESAAGIAGVAKILLQLKHKQLVPTIHSDEVNPNIEFKESPFYLQHKLTPWESTPDNPRRALINSFGAGGVNACLVIQEYEKPKVLDELKETGSYLVILSAKHEESLRESVNRLLTYVGKIKKVNLANLSYTLQVGREAMQERLAILVSDKKELIDRLNDWRQKKTSDKIYQGSIDPSLRKRKSKRIDEEEQLKTLYETSDLTKLAEMWILGAEINWEDLYPENKPVRMALPTYPFRKERYWISDALIPEKKTGTEQKNDQLHPLVSYNSSTLSEVSFSSLLSDSEFYSLDHQVYEEKIFPGSGFLEIANITGNIAGELKVSKITDIVWIHPLSFKGGSQMIQTFLKPNGKSTEYQITSFNDESERIVHSEGKLFFQNGINHTSVVEKSISVKSLIEKCSKPQNSDYFYKLFKKAGFDYGPAFQTVQEFYVNHSYAISKIRIADNLKNGFDNFILHPSILDGAMQTVAGLIGSVSENPYLPFAIDEIEIIRPLPQTCYAYVEFADSEKQIQTDIKKFNIQLLNENGDILIKLKNFYARALKNVMADSLV